LQNPAASAATHLHLPALDKDGFQLDGLDGMHDAHHVFRCGFSLAMLSMKLSFQVVSSAGAEIAISTNILPAYG